MEDFATFLSDSDVAKIILDSLPYGYQIIDEKGIIRSANNILKRMLGMGKGTIIGKATGEAIGCLNAFESLSGCGSTDSCQECDVRNLIFKTFSEDQKKRGQAQIQLVINGQVRDLNLKLSTIPFKFNDRRFVLVIMENITELRLLTPAKVRKGFRGIVGRSKKMRDLFETIKRVARTDAPVLLQGETGTGKELVAQAIHKESLRFRKHFVPVNCAALPEGLLETELFGHVKGAFTGAIHGKKGRFELANGGTIFLDEISELRSSLQVKLLRVLEDGRFERIGSERTIQADLRIISATNRNLEKEMLLGNFRKDLFYRLSVLPIYLPPLRDRRDDIPLLIEHFIGLYSENVMARRIDFSRSALNLFLEYSWPGNVRELQNAIRFALIRCHSGAIGPQHLPRTILLGMQTPQIFRRRKHKLTAEAVLNAMKKAGGNKSRAAKILGVHRSTLYRFLNNQNSHI